MTSSVVESRCSAVGIEFSVDSLTVHLSDGRSVAVPIEWYPRLLHGTHEERDRWEFIGDGEGIRWPALDEDVSVSGILRGIPSQESHESLRRWLETRSAGKQYPAPERAEE
jgi:Protein of unknown function (DUF3532).